MTLEIALALTRIEGEDGGRAFAADYPYRRAPSSAASRCGAGK